MEPIEASEESPEQIEPDAPVVEPPKAISNAQRNKRALIFLLLFFGACLVILTFVQRKLIFRPVNSPPLVADDWGFEEGRCLPVSVTASDGCELHGWHVLPESHQALDLGEQKDELALLRPVILIFPGNAAHRGYRSETLRRMSNLRADVFLFDYRGYAENRGSPSEKALLDDARQIWNHLTKQLEIAPERILVVGESLGGGVATGLVSSLSKEGISPGGLFLKATFNSLVETAGFHFPLLPVSWLLWDRFPSEERITSVTCPISMIHGYDDKIVPYQLGAQLYQAAPEVSASGIPKKMIELPGVGHNDIMHLAAQEYLGGLNEMLQTIREELIQHQQKSVTTPE